MKISIYEIPVEAEKEYKLKLFRIGDRIVVALADNKGQRIYSSSLVAFTDNMEVVRCCSVNNLLGIPLTDLSQLKMVGVDD